ncbi:hypothetical protein PCANC_17751 [Puccinia coronata f. sp. avenae]|uniref:Uncharacterized protein n=1 Tax=Puccinia coronata f. sp. avenae TaxID=200324 RepID=A0A2N5UZ39_9BASI|nr:hypothetical protein PCANC_17751 [Puccinia coronata f. sp. avenae]
MASVFVQLRRGHEHKSLALPETGASRQGGQRSPEGDRCSDREAYVKLGTARRTHRLDCLNVASASVHTRPHRRGLRSLSRTIAKRGLLPLGLGVKTQAIYRNPSLFKGKIARSAHLPRKL